MIDLEDAAADLAGATAHIRPDLAGVRSQANRRRRRRTAGALAALGLLGAGAAAAMVVRDPSADQQRVISGSEPDSSGAASTTATSPDGGQLLDIGLLRITVPDGWQVVGPGQGGCGGPKTIVIGPVAPNVLCSDEADVRILPIEGHPNPSPTGTINDIPVQGPIVAGVGTGSTVHLPTLRQTLVFAEGVDADLILSTIAHSDQEVPPETEIRLPCGPVVVEDRADLDLPLDLQVEPVVGMGGWAPGTGDGACAVNLTSPDNPGRHVTFAKGSLPYGFGEQLGGAGTAANGVRWGTIEDGFGGEVGDEPGDTDLIYVLAYGVSEDEAAALFLSLANA